MKIRIDIQQCPKIIKWDHFLWVIGNCPYSKNAVLKKGMVPVIYFKMLHPKRKICGHTEVQEMGQNASSSFV